MKLSLKQKACKQAGKNQASRHSKKEKRAPKPPYYGRVLPKDLGDIEALLKKHLGFDPRPFQIEAVTSQMLGKDTIVHAGTGMGKTVIAMGPHFHPSSKGRLTIMVSPLVALQNEQLDGFNSRGIKAIALNSRYGGCSHANLQKLKRGDFQILLISPELLLSKRFLEVMMRDPEFASRILSVVVDEAHVVSSWGAGFRKKYGELGMIRAFLPKNAPIVAMSATLPARVRRDVLQKLEFPPDDYMFINVGNDRPNVAIVVRAIHNTMKSYSDLDFIIPEVVNQPTDVQSTLVYGDNVAEGTTLADLIDGKLPKEWQKRGLVRPFNAGFSQAYRERVLRLFKLGIVRVLVCTDAAGMGCDLPKVDLVVQWKMPDSISTFVQRAGRAARSPGTTGMAVLLVEKSAYNEDLRNLDTTAVDPAPKSKQSESHTHKAGTAAQPVQNKDKRTKKEVQQYAAACGVNRGKCSGDSDDLPAERVQPRIDVKHTNEGLYALIQTTVCRRRVLLTVYDNLHAGPVDPSVCCDLCNPKLLDRVRPGKPPATERRKAVKKREEIASDVWFKLDEWRVQIHKRDWPRSLFGPSAILSDDDLELLSRAERVETLDGFKKLVHQWSWRAKYADELWPIWEAATKELGAVSAADEPPHPSSSTSASNPTITAAVVEAQPSAVTNTITRNPSTAPSTTNPSNRPSIPGTSVFFASAQTLTAASSTTSRKRRANEVDESDTIAYGGEGEEARDGGQGQRRRRTDRGNPSTFTSSSSASFSHASLDTSHHLHPATSHPAAPDPRYPPAPAPRYSQVPQQHGFYSGSSHPGFMPSPTTPARQQSEYLANNNANASRHYANYQPFDYRTPHAVRVPPSFPVHPAPSPRYQSFESHSLDFPPTPQSPVRLSAEQYDVYINEQRRIQNARYQQPYPSFHPQPADWAPTPTRNGSQALYPAQSYYPPTPMHTPHQYQHRIPFNPPAPHPQYSNHLPHSPSVPSYPHPPPENPFQFRSTQGNHSYNGTTNNIR